MILINGIEEDKIAVTDRGLTYGDGVFRTLAARGGKPLCWRLHYAKLRGDCERLGIPAPGENILLDEIASVAQDMTECVIKIIVTRGQGTRGYTLPLPAQPTRIVIRSPLPNYPAENTDKGIKARICELRLADQPRLAGVKHLNRLENVLARAEWNDSRIAEGLLLDQHGNIIEGVMSNLFILRSGVLLTPDLSRCGVAGATRERILAWADQTGIPAKIQDIPLNTLWDAEEVMVCNSLIGVWQIREIDKSGKIWERGTLTPSIREYLAKY
ncbi:MAG: aminodeoxychorismate lyase [Sulfuricellaceae bacterium]